ncbi:hypothetical protein SETIT_7G181600v2 [Setaria italica]|uniref:Uncharacterized protein n=1 Tax=Setaria italica TaxID=4555 RepID=A0A368RXA0_SETIT|nr:hypothetical protein SETIT_7G181600v2 [Setaria italica]
MAILIAADRQESATAMGSSYFPGTKSQKTFRQSRAPFSHPLPASDGPHRASGPMIVLSYTVHKLVRAVVIHELYILAHSPMRY